MRYPYRYAPDAQVSGAIMSAIFNHYRRDSVIDSLKQHNLDYFDADQWYPVDQFINLLAEWSQLPEIVSNYVSVGMAMTYHIELPEELEALDAMTKIHRLGDFMMSQHRGAGVGSFTARITGEKSVIYTESTLWPDDIIYGYIYGAARRYLPRGTHFRLAYADDQPRQADGAAQTVLTLSWEESR